MPLLCEQRRSGSTARNLLLFHVSKRMELRRGVWIEGKLTDKVTGKPLKGYVEYFALHSNPNLRDYPGFDGTALIVALKPSFCRPAWTICISFGPGSELEPTISTLALPVYLQFG